MSKISLTKEKTIQILNNSLERGRLMGAFSLKDSHAIKQARDYFNPDVKDKPTFDRAENPEIAAINIFLQAVQKAQQHGGEFAYTFEDSALLWEIVEFWIKESGQSAGVVGEATASAPKEREAKDGRAAKAAVTQIRAGQRDAHSSDEEDHAETVRPPNRSRSAGKKSEITEL